jgi:hypothetical protein
MSDFCYECCLSDDPTDNDLVGTTVISALCEGCGPGLFNALGQRVDPLGVHVPRGFKRV